MPEPPNQTQNASHQFGPHALPPVLPLSVIKVLCAKLAHVPRQDLEDAVQQIWLLSCQGEDPVAGLVQWQRQELSRCPGMTDLPRQRGRPRHGTMTRPRTEALTEQFHTGPQGQVKQQF